MDGAARGLGWGLALAAVFAFAACDREQPEAAASLVIPGLAQAQDRLTSLRLRGPGNAPVVTLEKKGGAWIVRERDGWAADAGRISQYLFVLSQARRVEAKTASPALYGRLGVEPVSAPKATGTELEVSGPGLSTRLLIGKEHARFNSNYVRLHGEPQSWLTDLPVTFDPDPAAWLDRRLIDLPLARVAAVRVADPDGARFSLSHRDDRFRLDDAPSAAMRDSNRGDELAGALDQLQLEDVLVADSAADVARTLTFDTVDGIEVVVTCSRLDGRTWVRLAARLDEPRALRWLAQSGKSASQLASLDARQAAWTALFQGRQFLVSEETATTLFLSHDAILAGAVEP